MSGPLLPTHRWAFPPLPDDARALEAVSLNQVVQSVLLRRGFTRPPAARAFLARERGDDDPFRLADMDRAVDRIRDAIARDEPIAIYGDFDADGVTAVAVLDETLRALGADVRTFIPHRERHGYGLHAAALEALARDGARLVVTVDCGVRDIEPLGAAARAGLDVIVTDHHLVPDVLPEAVAIVDPHRRDCPYGFTGLSGAGLAYKLSQALARRECEQPIGRNRAPSADDLLDLVAVGTVGDVVPLTGENRYLVHRGIERLRQRKRPGIAALMAVAKLDPAHLTSRALAFGLVPRLNAAGRMDHANTALDLLTTDDPARARALAARLNDLNQARRAATEHAVDAAEASLADRARDGLLLYADERMPLGIIGLVAGRLAERHYRPAAAVRIDGETARGSVRSIPELDITAVLDGVSGLLTRFGGHPRAAGFALRTADLPRLTALMNDAVRAGLTGRDLRPLLVIDAELPVDNVVLSTFDALDDLSPFGEGNPRPHLLLRGVRVAKPRLIGVDHLRFHVESPDGTARADAVAFGQASRLADIVAAGPVDLVAHLRRDEWGGAARAELDVLDMAAAGRGLAQTAV